MHFGKGSYKNYKFGSKELQEYGAYDFGARIYMADIARWFAVDPMAEHNPGLTPYRYGFNNPVMFTDPDGMLEQALTDKMWALGGTWYNTGDGFENESNIKLGYEGNYLSLNTALDSPDGGGGGGGGTAGTIQLPGMMLSGSSFFWGMNIQNQFNAFMEQWNAKSNFAWDRSNNAGRLADGPIQYVGGAGDPFGVWEVGGMALSGMSGGKGNYILAALMITRSGSTGSTLKLLNAEKGIISGNSQKMLASYYPLDGGAMGKWSNITLKIGNKIDRFGSNYGKYFSNVGTPMEMRALPPGNTGAYTAFEVLKPFTVQTSKIAPAFGNIGTGVQYYSPFLNANELIMGGFIKPIP